MVEAALDATREFERISRVYRCWSFSRSTAFLFNSLKISHVFLRRGNFKISGFDLESVYNFHLKYADVFNTDFTSSALARIPYVCNLCLIIIFILLFLTEALRGLVLLVQNSKKYNFSNFPLCLTVTRHAIIIESTISTASL